MTAEEFRAALFAHVPEETVALEIDRNGAPLKVEATLAAPSRPKKLAEHRAVLGLGMAPTEGEDGIAIRFVQPGSPAAATGQAEQRTARAYEAARANPLDLDAFLRRMPKAAQDPQDAVPGETAQADDDVNFLQ